MNIKYLIFGVIFLASAPQPTSAQDRLTIDDCYRAARDNYPLIRRQGLIDRSAELNLSNAAKGYLPQFSLSGKASYQSDVTSVPIRMAGLDVPVLSKDQYQASVELNQTIWDGGAISSRKKVISADSETDREQLEVSLYTLRERINGLFFGALLYNEMLAQNAILQDNIATNIGKIEAMIANGTANATDLEQLEVELIDARQGAIEQASARDTYMLMLSSMIGRQIPSIATLEVPKVSAADTIGPISRPELSAFDAQLSATDARLTTIKAGTMPTFSFFLQGGYGRPGLDMLKNSFSPYGMGGVRLAWNFGRFYTLANDKRIVENSRDEIETSRATFLFNTSIDASGQEMEIRKTEQLIESDASIVALRESIRQSSEIRLINGVITTTDLVRDINAENIARQNQVIHRVQLMMAIYKYKYTMGM